MYIFDNEKKVKSYLIVVPIFEFIVVRENCKTGTTEEIFLRNLKKKLLKEKL
jgi:hypothetical protein